MLQVRVRFELLIERRHRHGTVVVARIHARLSRKYLNEALERLIHDLGIAADEVTTAATLDEECVAGHDRVTNAIGRRARRVPGGVHHRDLEMVADADDVAWALTL